jgi:acetyl-CoA carboxylase carboxyl transferase subunit beta
LSWIANFVRPKLREWVGGRKDVPDNLWHKCPGCGQMIFHRDLAKNLHVCQHCGHHIRLGAHHRLGMLFDDEKFEQINVPRAVADPLKFRDIKKYSDRLKESQTKTKMTDAIVVGKGAVGGRTTVMAAFDFAFMGGSMGIAVGEGVVTAARAAIEAKAPLVVLTSSGGARMQEGIHSLMQLARTTIAVEEVRDAGLPYIVILCDPTTGGVSASLAMLGDIHIAEPGAVIGFAGQRVIEQTIRETLPEGFQRAEYLYEHGMVDMVVPRAELRDTLARVIDLLMGATPLPSTLADDRVEVLPPAKAAGVPARTPPSDADNDIDEPAKG